MSTAEAEVSEEGMGFRQALLEWLRGVGWWFRSLLPSQRAKMLKIAYERGFADGKNAGREEVCRKLATMNRDQRRGTVKEIVREFGD